MLVTNIGRQTASIKIFDKNLMESQLLHFTISNLWDLEEQLYQLQIEVHKILKDYAVHDPLAKQGHITSYYNSTAYRDMMHACLL